MRRRHRAPGGLLAFLDVMACGLGASILLFLIVRHHEGKPAEPAPEPASGTVEQLAELESEAAALDDEIKELKGELAEALEQQQEQDPVPKNENTAQIADLQRKIAREKALNAQLRREIESFPPEQSGDPVADPQRGEENYLIGLKVEGRNIALLVDRSASMTDEKLIDIIGRKVGSDSNKQAGPKWQRTLRTVRWLLQRLPAASKATVVAYNDKAAMLGQEWFNAKDKTAIEEIYKKLDELVPTGGTNLEAGFRKIGELDPIATDIYLVTDGLPTQAANTRSHCEGTVDGPCRVQLFNPAARFALGLGARINVVLLPLEGDPEAVSNYWMALTSPSRGTLLTPAGSWP